MFHRTTRAVALGAILALAAVGPALADTSNVSESVTVLSGVTLVLDKASINYGTVLPGGSTADQTVNATIGGVLNGPSWSLTITGTAFSAAGGKTMPATARKFAGGGTNAVQATAGSVPVTDTGTVLGTFGYDFHVAAPSNAQQGAYSGTMTWTLTAN